MDYVKEIVYVFRCGKCGTHGEVETDWLNDAVSEMRRKGWRVGKEENTCPNCHSN